MKPGVSFHRPPELAKLRESFPLSIRTIPANQELFDWATDHEHSAYRTMST